ITEPAIICHGFNGAGKGWVPEFRVNERFRWNEIKVKAYIVQNPDDEILLACVQAPSSGTYALFGYYPVDQKEAEIEPEKIENANTVNGHWNTGKEVGINLLFTPAPDWLKIFSRGVVIASDQWVEICHPFAFGNTGWEGEIRQLKADKTWAFVNAEKKYIPTIEGTLNICAWVGEGTYALFGYLK
ncbi:MAG: hypothetical protein Q8O06_12460, partial [Acetobacterium sp.]|nr:hypothetical protein [Acetobacterium sp.]